MFPLKNLARKGLNYLHQFSFEDCWMWLINYSVYEFHPTFSYTSLLVTESALFAISQYVTVYMNFIPHSHIPPYLWQNLPCLPYLSMLQCIWISFHILIYLPTCDRICPVCHISVCYSVYEFHSTFSYTSLLVTESALFAISQYVTVYMNFIPHSHIPPYLWQNLPCLPYLSMLQCIWISFHILIYLPTCDRICPVCHISVCYSVYEFHSTFSYTSLLVTESALFAISQYVTVYMNFIPHSHIPPYLWQNLPCLPYLSMLQCIWISFHILIYLPTCDRICPVCHISVRL